MHSEISQYYKKTVEKLVASLKTPLKQQEESKKNKEDQQKNEILLKSEKSKMKNVIVQPKESGPPTPITQSLFIPRQPVERENREVSSLKNIFGYDMLIRTPMFGNVGTGRSSLLLRIGDNTFNESFLATIGVDFKIKTFDHHGKIFKLQMWDYIDERFNRHYDDYRPGMHAALVLYDITDRQSFQDLENWMNEIEKYAANKLILFIVGTRLDLDKNRKVTKEEAEIFAESISAFHLEVSSKTGENIDMLEKKILDALYDKYYPAKISSQQPPSNHIPKEEKKKPSFWSGIFK